MDFQVICNGLLWYLCKLQNFLKIEYNIEHEFQVYNVIQYLYAL